MATLPEISKEMGLDPLVCGGCGRHIKTTRLLRALFSAVLERLKAGEKIKIQKFGTFRSCTHTPRGFAAGGKPSRTVRFTLTPIAKCKLQGDPDD